TVNEGSQKSTGFELDAQYLVEQKMLVFLSYSYVDSQVFNQGVNVAANGHRPRATPYDSIGGAISYDLGHGLRAAVNMRYQGNTPAESPSTGLIKNPITGLFEANDGRLNLRTPAFAVWNANLIYRWKSRWPGLDQSLNLAVKNIFDKRYIAPG